MGLQKTGVIALLAALAPAWALEYPVRHEHLRKGCAGTLAVDERGVSFHGANGKHAWSWTYQDIQQLTLAPGEIRVLTYQDNAWKLGADREYRFHAAGSRPFGEVYELLKGRLDQRLVAQTADAAVTPLWQIPVKRLKLIRGSEGELVVGEDRIVYRTAAAGDARTWRYEDVDSIASSGPFELTITTFERARAQYGGLQSFRFQLKRPLDEDRYNDLWRRLNRRKGVIRTPE